MKRSIITTSDGSNTIHLPEWGEQYHSKHGAVQEARHVYIDAGLKFVCNTLFPETVPINILEVGFGTGLNAFLTVLESEKHLKSIHYLGVEAFPLSQAEIAMLNYPSIIDQKNRVDTFFDLHQVSWHEQHNISPHFKFEKQLKDIHQINHINEFHLVYFDAFCPRVQPELWTEDLLALMFAALKPHGCLVTYSAKGSVRRTLFTVGFRVERLPGPPGKREMLRAVKP